MERLEEKEREVSDLQVLDANRFRKGMKKGMSKDCLRGDGSRGIERCGGLAIR
jgi:hypothetical protein